MNATDLGAVTRRPVTHAAYFDDFERWCEECVTVADKLSGLPVPFRLNAPQKRLARVMEARRRAGRPVRVILLKARQWGGSTLVQAYMAWHQLVRAKGRNALVCAHVKDAAALIRSTYSLLLAHYPAELKPGGEKEWQLRPYQQTQGTLWVPARQARLAITSAGSPDGLRGASYHLAHLSEAAFWGDGDPATASAIVRTVCGTVPSAPDTVVVIESTANGPDNWFAAEWRRAVAGRSDKTPVFVPWHEIEIYRKPLSPSERERLPALLDDYELRLMADGVRLDALAWYHDKRREYSTHAEMMAEFPSTPEEAFATSGGSPFPAPLLEGLAQEAPADLSPTLLVAVCAESFVLAPFAVSEGRIHALPHLPADSPEALMALAERELRRHPGSSLAVADCAPPGTVRHGRWCLRFASCRSLPLCYAAEEPLLTLTDDLLGEMADIQLHLLGERRLRDCLPGATALYRRFSPAHAHRSPLLLGRLCAGYLLEDALLSPTLSPAEFYD